MTKRGLTDASNRAILTVLTQLIQFVHIQQEVVSTININYRDPRPIYEQVRDGLRTLIVSGVLPGGEKLPSVRELASQLAINPNTIQRAYRELERAGIDTQRRDALLRRFDETVKELRYLGVSAEALRARMEKGEDEDA